MVFGNIAVLVDLIAFTHILLHFPKCNDVYHAVGKKITLNVI